MRIAALMFALAVIACTPPTTNTPAPPATSAATATAPFVIGAVQDTDANIQGCTVLLSPENTTPQTGYTFIEDGMETGAVGFIRIDGAVVRLTLASDASTETGGVRTFASPDNATRVVETYTHGEAHEQSDSVGRTAELAITHNGASQTLRVRGGAVC